MGLIIIGVLLIVGAVILYFVSRSNARLAMAAGTAELTAVGDLQTVYRGVSGEVGIGLFTQQVGLQGRIECEQPLASELAGVACVAYRFRVERRWEEDYEERDSEGQVRRGTRSGSDTVASNERSVPFWLNDGSARLPVTPDGAKIDMEKVHDRFEPGNPGKRLQHGSLQIDLGNVAVDRRRIIGYHYAEEVLPLGRTVYILGAASDAAGTLGIARDQEEKAPFVISFKTREQLIKSSRQTALFTRYAAYACAAIGAILAIVGAVHH
jgi:hypothetical protein